MAPTALVTGTSSGIGHATAIALRDAGYTVFAGARSPDDLDRLADEGLRPVRLDVTDEPSMQAAVAAAEAGTGRVDLLVNNAGYGQMGPIEEVSIEQWRRQFETNVFGLVRLCQLVLPGMRQARSGRIVNVDSAGGEFTFPLAGAYSASKHAVESVSDALRFEVAPHGIAVVLIQPGMVDTPLAARTAAAIVAASGSAYADMTTRFAAAMRAPASLGGVIPPEEVAEAIVAAATADSAPTRVKVGAVAERMAAARRSLSDRDWDAMLAAQLGLGTVTRRAT